MRSSELWIASSQTRKIWTILSVSAQRTKLSLSGYHAAACLPFQKLRSLQIYNSLTPTRNCWNHWGRTCSVQCSAPLCKKWQAVLNCQVTWKNATLDKLWAFVEWFSYVFFITFFPYLVIVRIVRHHGPSAPRHLPVREFPLKNHPKHSSVESQRCPFIQLLHLLQQNDTQLGKACQKKSRSVD